jgi:hypothetical protein
MGSDAPYDLRLTRLVSGVLCRCSGGMATVGRLPVNARIDDRSIHLEGGPKTTPR